MDAPPRVSILSAARSTFVSVPVMRPRWFLVSSAAKGCYDVPAVEGGVKAEAAVVVAHEIEPGDVEPFHIGLNAFLPQGGIKFGAKVAGPQGTVPQELA